VRTLVERLLRYFFPGHDEHISDERLAALFCRELSVAARWITRRHLTKCPYCRVRRERLEGPRAERVLQVYREGMEGADPILPSRPRVVFAHWLDTQMRHRSALEKRHSRPRNLALLRFSALLPAGSAGVALGLLAGASVFGYWWWQRVPNLSANALLVRAEQSDVVSLVGSSGVIHQTVRIRTAKQTIDRSLYRDIQGRRHPHRSTLARPQEQLKAALDNAGIDWDQLISASDYQAWHDRQHERSDRIVRSSPHLLTLTTTVPEGPVSRESLTVRDSDFHPLRRTVDFRDNSETVELAELDFAVLPWSAVDANAFEPLASALSAPLARALPVLPRPQVSADVLDETELAARLTLDKLHADTGEQIEVRRTAQQVEVDGLVDTEERQRALTTELMMVPRLKVSIQSLAHLTDHPFPAGETIRVEEASLPDQASALDTYLRARGHSVEESSILARRLFDCALTMSQESGAIEDLKARFAPPERLSIIGSATLGSLLYSHRERLETTLREQRALLALAEGDRVSGRALRPVAYTSLGDAAARNLAFSRELTQTANPPVRNAEAILADIAAAMEDISAAMHR
jgi:hypothetical protein